jgi:nicotinamide-nucleotide amidase
MIDSLILKLSEKLIKNHLKLVTVESCTGGGIGKAITEVAGSSLWYEAGLITYSNLSKKILSNVAEETLILYGAVSIEVAESMAKGVSIFFPDRMSVSVTGVAGPSGGSKDKPVGTVCIACHYLTKIESRRFQFKGSREEVRNQSIEKALKLCLSMEL